MKTNLKEIKDDFYVFSGKTSAISRQLAFAGIAIIWFFKIELPTHIQLGNELIGILRLLVICLLLDFCHAFVPTIIYGISNIYHRGRGKKDEDEIKLSQAWTIPDWIFFLTKILFLLWAYINLWKYLSEKLL